MEEVAGELLLVIGVAANEPYSATFSDCYYPTGHFIALKRTYLPCDGCFASTLVDPRRELLGRETKNERECVRKGKRERETA